MFSIPFSLSVEERVVVFNKKEDGSLLVGVIDSGGMGGLFPVKFRRPRISVSCSFIFWVNCFLFLSLLAPLLSSSLEIKTVKLNIYFTRSPRC